LKRRGRYSACRETLDRAMTIPAAWRMASWRQARISARMYKETRFRDEPVQKAGRLLDRHALPGLTGRDPRNTGDIRHILYRGVCRRHRRRRQQQESGETHTT
jgi:hypothetical protein